MSREALLDLASELDRLLAAGARSAAGSDSLRRRARVVEELAVKVPALVPLKEAIDKVLTAPAKDAPVALLDLLTRARQMRAGLGNSDTPGEIGSVPARDVCKTPLTTRRAHELYDTFHGSGGKQDAIQVAIREGEIYDLRLQQTLVDALEDKDAAFADMVSKDALPKLGTAVLGDLVADLELAEGDASDARRLQSICRIDRQAGAELARKALKEGSVKLVTQALASLPGVVPASDAESVGLEYARDKRATVRAAALQALRTSKKAEALDAVLAATEDKSEDVVRAAYAALGVLEHPDTPDRIMAAVTEQLDNLTSVPKVTAKKKKAPAKGTKKPAKGKAATPAKVVTQADADAALRQRRDELRWVGELLEALARRPDIKREDVGEFIVPLLKHKEHWVRNAAEEVLVGVGPTVPKMLPYLKKAIESGGGYDMGQHIEMLRTAPPKVRGELLPLLIKVSLRGWMDDEDILPLARMLRDHDPRGYPDYVEKLLASKMYYHWVGGVREVRALPEAEAVAYLKPAVEGLLRFLNHSGSAAHAGVLFLIRRDDPAGKVVAPRLCKALTATKQARQKLRLLRLLETLGSLVAAAKPTVEKLLKGSKKDLREQITKTLAALG